MGIDVQIEFEFDGTDAELHEMAYDMARRVDASYFHEHPCIQRESTVMQRYGGNGGQSIACVMTWMRWWGPGYERGPWTDTRSALSVLLAHQAAGHIGRLWHYGDCGDRDDSAPWTVEEQERFDEHFATGHWGYRWDDRSIRAFPHEADPPAPIDSYGKSMRRHGWGPNFAAYHSPATGEQREWRHGEWVAPA